MDLGSCMTGFFIRTLRISAAQLCGRLVLCNGLRFGFSGKVGSPHPVGCDLQIVQYRLELAHHGLWVTVKGAPSACQGPTEIGQ